jgi:hypothetical protein
VQPVVVAEDLVGRVDGGDGILEVHDRGNYATYSTSF